MKSVLFGEAKGFGATGAESEPKFQMFHQG
jgi:hypothetical protein